MTRASYHHGNLHEALLQAARELLADSGVEDLSLRKLARAAGVSATAPYSHFRDKQSLLAELATEGFDELADSMESHAASAGGDTRQRLMGLAQGYVAFATSNPALFQLMFGPAVSGLLEFSALVASGTRAYQLMEHTVRAHLEAAGRAAETPVVAAAAWSMVHGLSTLLKDGRLEAGRQGLPDQAALVTALCGLLEPMGSP
jgi:AcrR family transcriptional regulator